MPTVDLAAYAPFALLVVILIAAFFAALGSMRDPIEGVPHLVSRGPIGARGGSHSELRGGMS
jgi:hypothetical protein